MGIKPAVNKVISQNISYYNEIAGQYDKILIEDAANEVVRKKVSERFCQLIPAGLVLDFGGGTGMDLPWLSAKGYDIIFCEPSSAMKEKAIQRIQRTMSEKNISILDDSRCDHIHWIAASPFPQKVDAILANFAVINCIPDIHTLFKSWAFVMKPGAHLLALVLQSNFKRNFRLNRFAAIRSLFLNKPVQMNIAFNTNSQTITLYNSRQLSQASAAWFGPIDYQPFPENDFALVHFIRK
jgi:SAM-dependent methyltransferase